MVFIAGLPKDPAVDRDNSIGAEDDGVGVSPVASRALLSGQVQSVSRWDFVRSRWALLHFSWVSLKSNAETPQQVDSSGRTRGQNYGARSRIVRHSTWYVCG
jgi:hypothetical protein